MAEKRKYTKKNTLIFRRMLRVMKARRIRRTVKYEDRKGKRNG